MIKRIIKKICYQVYRIGYNEANNLLSKERHAFLKANIKYNPDNVDIDNDAVIINHRKNPNYIQIGNRSWVRGELLVYKHGGNILIGDDCLIGSNSKIWSSINIKIGNRVLISHNVNIHDNISHPLDAEERHRDFLYIKKNKQLRESVNIREQEIVIENDVWVGFNSTILKGVKIGEGSIIGANTVITKNIPPFSVVIGNPAKIIKNVKKN